MEILTMEQGTEEWHLARAGIPTASEFSNVMMQTGPRVGIPKWRETYMRRLVGELITGKPEETHRSAEMERGHAMEDEARDLYCYLKDYQVVRIGIGTNFFSCSSPDYM